MIEKIKEISSSYEKKTKLEQKIEEVKEKWIEKVINDKNKTFWDKLNSWFNKIDFLELEQADKAEVAMKVKKDASPDRLYWIEIFLSGIIASFGLLQNSVAVIIGAMLIAPFLRPINGIAFGIARGEKKFFFNSVKVLIISSFVSIFMWFLVMNITWLYKETPEILARTSPNIIDLFIAIFSAMVALLSLRYKRLWESVAWVAMAAALMPPLWVIWMELALWNYNLAWWASMLFITNIVAIIIVWVWAFWLYWFTPNDWWKQKKAFIRIFLILFLIAIISIPLVKNLLFLRDKWYVEKQIQNNIYVILNKKINNFSITDIKINELNKENVNILVQIKLLQWTKFYNEYSDFLNKQLSNKVWRNVKVNIELNKVESIISIEEEKKNNLKELKKQEEKKLEISKNQENYINKIKQEFQDELNLKLKKQEEIKKDLEEAIRKEFDILLDKKIEKIKKIETWK